MGELTKVCTTCGEEKALDEFTKSARGRLGRHAWCKPCHNIYQRRWQKENPEAVREQKRRHREAHRDQINEYKRARYHENVEKSREQQRLWRLMNPDKVMTRNALAAEKRRWDQLRRDHGLTPEDFYKMWKKQKGRCPICQCELVPRRISREEMVGGLYSAHVDHCHTTGAIRGLLCGTCNQGLGMFQDNEDTLQRAKNYLRKSRR